MDKFTVSNVNAQMRNAAGICVLDKDQITGLQVTPGDIGAVLILGTGSSVELDAVLLEYILYKAGAIEPGRGTSAPNIGNANVFLRSCNHRCCGGASGI